MILLVIALHDICMWLQLLNESTAYTFPGLACHVTPHTRPAYLTFTSHSVERKKNKIIFVFICKLCTHTICTYSYLISITKFLIQNVFPLKLYIKIHCLLAHTYCTLVNFLKMEISSNP